MVREVDGMKAILLGCTLPILIMMVLLALYMAFEDREVLEQGGEPIVAQVEREMGK